MTLSQAQLDKINLVAVANGIPVRQVTVADMARNAADVAAGLDWSKEEILIISSPSSVRTIYSPGKNGTQGYHQGIRAPGDEDIFTQKVSTIKTTPV